MIKKTVPLIFSLSLITIVFNILLIIDFVIKNYAGNSDFSSLVIVLTLASAQLIFLSRSVYKNNVTNGAKSIKKLTNVILFINWLDLMFVVFAFIEGINAQQNPFTNINVIIPWTIITLVVISIRYIHSKQVE
ncbi:hypothetical protein [Clostridium estertheticum]|uniref:Uncharacterized protein n=1 Tax=Clostridium estertheticum subsp. estertheticum TaxID=1552 RepID=A0A1J0GCY9_9CLOT|nr:hypothetical protein [Clostridium estertheticum]APC39217.1 hypothetical protein A7L45_03645 [Clostridium estertheticum subsp. estertheticum]MBU3071864.1 hypothetical protein [Clostridium estertheticum]MBU3161956.1 hypothetical protein [Clostridium estertheticum]MBU3171207.1 hypothetical protein [Clostridium estertheticum]MBU3183321.1 hypothetical protein [Clostridium estertheticum]